MTRTKTITIAAVALGAIAVAVWIVRHTRAAGETGYRFATVELGTVLQTVSATGALSAVKTVQVGTQASGQVAEIHADFNDVVKKGQLLARIDPVLQQQAVSDAQAQLEKAQAQLLQAQQEYDRNEPLFTQQFISATEFGTMQVNQSVAVAAAEVGPGHARQGQAKPVVHEHLRADRRRDRRARCRRRDKPSPPAFPRRSSFSSRKTWRRCRSSPRSTRATSAASRTDSRRDSPWSRFQVVRSTAWSSRCACSRSSPTTWSATPSS